MKKGKVTYMYCMALRSFKAILLNGFQSFMSINLKMSLSVLTDWWNQCWSCDCLQTIPQYYPDHQNKWATSKCSDVVDSNYSTAEKHSIKKKLKQVTTESGWITVPFRYNIQSYFCYIVFGTFWFSSWGKKKFLYSNLSTECQYKMCEYIHLIHTRTHSHISRKQHLTTSPFLTNDSIYKLLL